MLSKSILRKLHAVYDADNTLSTVRTVYGDITQSDIAERLNAICDIDLSKLDELEFDVLRKLLHSKVWPVAVDPNLILDENSESDKVQRAKSIINMIVDIDVDGKNFLDFGCGEGHVAEYVADKAKLSVGYDILPQNWSERIPPAVFTNDLSTLKELFDIVFVYDVLDHSSNIGQSLKEIRSIIKPEGKVFIRCHPWCSRHGTHLYKTLNKAYAHVVFTKEELASMGYVGLDTVKITTPAFTYSSLFVAAGFKIVVTSITKETPNNFFRNTPIVANRLRQHWETEYDNNPKFPSGQLVQQFHDYILSPN